MLQAGELAGDKTQPTYELESPFLDFLERFHSLYVYNLNKNSGIVPSRCN